MTNDIFTMIGMAVSLMVTILAIGFCMWCIGSMIRVFILRKLRVYKAFVEFCLYRKSFNEYMAKTK